MLIVNADDWGYNMATTDAIATAFRAGRVTSASAMVFMHDSERAAALADQESLPVGLHLNLMERYTAERVARAIRRRQELVVSSFQVSQRPRWLADWKLSPRVRQCLEDQIDEFTHLYATAPTHVDGHQHGHLSTPVLRSLARDPRPSVRCSFTFRRGEKSALNRALRFTLNRYIRTRFHSTDRFYSIRALHPRLGGYGLEGALAESHRVDVEIMVHPGLRDELEILMSDDWSRMLAGVPVGSFMNLAAGS